MKIKAVCEATGLTDRTVRFYIEEGLVTPKYQQNYLGRKTFDFSDEDIKTLESISIFRKYGFSVAEIKEIYEQPEKIISMAQQAKERLETDIAEDAKKIEILSLINTGRTYTPREFAIFLSLPIMEAPEKEDAQKKKKHAVWKIRDLIFETGAFHLFTGLLALYIICKQYLFPSVPWWGYLLYIVSAICVTVCFVWKAENIWKRHVFPAAAALLCWVLPIYTVFFPYIHSFTDDPKDYRVIDPCHGAFDSQAFHDLFPLRPSGTLLDYYYQTGNSFLHDEVYAEVRLNRGAFVEEVARVKEWFETHAISEDKEYNIYKFLTMKKGAYECLMLHGVFYGFPEGPKEGNPFALKEAGTYYSCLVFAYNEEKEEIRYIFYNRNYSEDTPYYLTVKW